MYRELTRLCTGAFVLLPCCGGGGIFVMGPSCIFGNRVRIHYLGVDDWLVALVRWTPNNVAEIERI